MGEEEIQQQQQQEEEVQAEPEESKEPNVVKILRQRYEEALKRLKELEKENERLKEITRVSDLEQLVEKVERIDFENAILKKYPALKDEIDAIYKERKPGESIEDVVARYIGKKIISQTPSQIEGYSLGSVQISTGPNVTPDYYKMPLEELEKLARKELEEKRKT